MSRWVRTWNNATNARVEMLQAEEVAWCRSLKEFKVESDVEDDVQARLCRVADVAGRRYPGSY